MISRVVLAYSVPGSNRLTEKRHERQQFSKQNARAKHTHDHYISWQHHSGALLNTTDNAPKTIPPGGSAISTCQSSTLPETGQSTSPQHLPLEIWQYVASYLTIPECGTFRLTNRTANKAGRRAIKAIYASRVPIRHIKYLARARCLNLKEASLYYGNMLYHFERSVGRSKNLSDLNKATTYFSDSGANYIPRLNINRWRSHSRCFESRLAVYDLIAYIINANTYIGELKYSGTTLEDVTAFGDCLHPSKHVVLNFHLSKISIMSPRHNIPLKTHLQPLVDFNCFMKIRAVKSNIQVVRPAAHYLMMNWPAAFGYGY